MSRFCCCVGYLTNPGGACCMDIRYGYWPTPAPNLQPMPAPTMGWCCPGCGRFFAPSTTYCPFCARPDSPTVGRADTSESA